jgi:hypothetical protein
MSYNTEKELAGLIVKINALRFEGGECDGCEDSTVYQVNEVTGIDAISTPSDTAAVEEMLRIGFGADAPMSCCGCGTVHDISILDAEESDDD